MCYLTAQELMRAEYGTNTAVGLVESDWGGSAEQAWQTKEFAVQRGCNVSTIPDGHCPLESTRISPTKPNYWACLYHGMIEPLTTSLRPEMVLWYQGEANSQDAQLKQDYQCFLGAMIAEWRLRFGNPKLPFFLVQLSAYYHANVMDNFPFARVAQANAAVAEQAHAPTGYAVTHVGLRWDLVICCAVSLVMPRHNLAFTSPSLVLSLS